MSSAGWKWLVFFALITGCQGDETLRSYAKGQMKWHLVEMDGAPLKMLVTLSLQEQGRISGQAPCNRYHATLTVPYPWFELGPIAATRMACPHLTLEARYFDLLRRSNITEVSGPNLILSQDQTPLLVFEAR